MTIDVGRVGSAETGSREPGLASRPVPSGFDPARIESWRAALIAFWKGEGCFQRAENLGRGEPFDHQDKRALESLQAALERAPKAA